MRLNLPRPSLRAWRRDRSHGGPGHHRAQLRFRVLAGVLAVTVVVLAAFDVTLVNLARRYLVGQTDSGLTRVANLYRPYTVDVKAPGGVPQPGGGQGSTRAGPPSVGAPLFAGRLPANWAPVSVNRTTSVQTVIGGPRVLLPAAQLDPYYVEFIRGAVRQVYVKGDKLLVPPRALATVVARARALAGFTITGPGNVPLRARAVPVAGGHLVDVTSLSDVNGTVRSLEIILVVGSLGALAVVGLGVTWILRRGLRPIETMAAQADRITAGDLTERVSNGNSRDEVGRLGTALDGMLARIHATVQEREENQEKTRRFFADASHELRTPLASLRANAELYQQGALRRRPQVDEAMRRIALEAQRMSGLVDDMLRLARLDQQPEPAHDPVDVSAVLRGCVERAQVSDPDRGWRADIADGLIVGGDEELLRRAADNLLANVTTHTPAGTSALISATRAGDLVRVEVSDDGPGVPAGQLPRLFERFYRAGAPSPRPGSGLGLAIVSAVAIAHQGAAAAAAAEPRGLRITLTLPAWRDPELAAEQPEPGYREACAP